MFAVLSSCPESLIRALFVIIPGFYAIGMLIVVLRLYLTYYRGYLRKPNTPLGATGYAFIFLCISKIIFVIAAVLYSSHDDEGWDIRTFLTGAAIFVSMLGVRFLVKAERARIFQADIDSGEKIYGKD